MQIKVFLTDWVLFPKSSLNKYERMFRLFNDNVPRQKQLRDLALAKFLMCRPVKKMQRELFKRDINMKICILKTYIIKVVYIK